MLVLLGDAGGMGAGIEQLLSDAVLSRPPVENAGGELGKSLIWKGRWITAWVA